jgi:hypothetical protein
MVPMLLCPLVLLVLRWLVLGWFRMLGGFVNVVVLASVVVDYHSMMTVAPVMTPMVVHVLHSMNWSLSHDNRATQWHAQ